ncbi:MAG: hypothetical protein SGI96_14415 [Bacteroidota bacterium]|nr:hypothetical protein [Bacteroidota bacterium]
MQEHFDTPLLYRAAVCSPLVSPASLSILLLHTYGILVKPAQLLHINRIYPDDHSFAEKRNLRVKLTAQAWRLDNGNIAAFVLPRFATTRNPPCAVMNVYAVLGDISNLRSGYPYEYREYKKHLVNILSNDFYLSVYVSFDSLAQVDLKLFEWLEELGRFEQRHYLIGTISCKKLLMAPWAQDPFVSILVYTDGISEGILGEELGSVCLSTIPKGCI